MANVPETVLRKRKRNEAWAAKKAAAEVEVRVCLGCRRSLGIITVQRVRPSEWLAAVPDAFFMYTMEFGPATG
jgi:predicted  nucleic acid-binding Zn-ribbon protein